MKHLSLSLESDLKFLQFSVEFPVFFIKERDVTQAQTGTDILDPLQHINHGGWRSDSADC